MRKLGARRATVRAAHAVSVGFAAAVLLAPVFGAGAVSAAPQQLSVGDLPAEMIDAISRDLHMTPQQYLDRAVAAQDLRSYANDFRADHPDAFAGAWLTPEGKGVIAVTNADAQRLAAADGYQTKIAPISANGLEGALLQLSQWVASLPREIAAPISSIAIDALNSQLILNVANTPTGHMLNLPTLIATIKVVLSPGGGGAVEYRPMGGDTYISSTKDLHDATLRGVDVCSFGFNSTDAAGNALNISAGHCNPRTDGGPASVYVPNVRDLPNSVEVGQFAKTVLGGPAALDYSVIKLNERAVNAGMDRPRVRGANGTTLTVTGIADPVTGAPVCKTGQSSTFTCGFVSADRVETQLFTAEGVSKTIRGFADSACTLGGDSGGAIITGTLALGITSGSNAADAPNCNEANTQLAPYGGTASLGVGIRSILADIEANSAGGLGSGITVRTAPRAS
ncbi:S1 family peptidase [Nocardia camponoti]|uniref:Serine protease n=1 Tax=Nocardia camponoti TaxID=1616106 RepID=A0A917QJU2_9NOCA|nr:S1 family peptidase [Nocardia camponoti]GGK52583.1 serine protease [Nocardia camponoti]